MKLRSTIAVLCAVLFALSVGVAAAAAAPGSQGCDGSHNSDSGNGANHSGPYDNTCDGSPSLNGNGGGQAVGKPCAGCVGNADDKNPQGQYPGGSDHNAGYECDRNHGIGRTNPAHTGCAATVAPPEECTRPGGCDHHGGGCATPGGCDHGGGNQETPTSTTSTTSRSATTAPQQLVLGTEVSGTSPAAARAPKAPKQSAPRSAVLGESSGGTKAAIAVPAPAATRERAARGQLPFTGSDLSLVLLLAGAVALVCGLGIRQVLARRT